MANKIERQDHDITREEPKPDNSWDTKELKGESMRHSIFSEGIEKRIAIFAHQRAQQANISFEDWLLSLAYSELLRDVTNRIAMRSPQAIDKAKEIASEKSKTRVKQFAGAGDLPASMQEEKIDLEILEFWYALRALAPESIRDEVKDIYEFHRDQITANAAVAA